MRQRVIYIISIALLMVLLMATACTTPPMSTSFPSTVRRVAVLPPYQPGAADARADTTNSLAGLPSRTIGDLLAEQARVRLAEKGLDVIAPSILKTATGGRVPTSAQTAAQMVQDARLDAAAMYIEVRRWEPTPDSRGMKADGVIVALDAVMIDPKTGMVLWEAHRPSRPVPVYGVVLTGQANVIVAETVMRELLGPIERRQPGAP